MTTVSVIVVSRGRPGPLGLCLTGIRQLCYPDFEIVVVADSAGIETVRKRGWSDRLKLVPFEQANISAARNAGFAVAAGEIVAFIDDDAVPEPTWIGHLAGPFADPGVTASGGYVIGRNGISLQWTARAADAQGRKVVLDGPGQDPFEPEPPAGFVTTTEGTNCAFRREALAGLGGFDPAFRFYLDETDVNLRLAAAGGRTVIAPRARVHHGYAASARRAADRAPLDLTEIGASSAVFLRKHAPTADPAAALADLRHGQRRALLEHMVSGGIEPRDVTRLLAGLNNGFGEGMARGIAPLVPLPPASDPFLPFHRMPATGVSRQIAGRAWDRARLRRAAAAAVAKGDIVTLFRFSLTARPHRVWFHPGGWWEQRGGLFGPAERTEPVFRLHGFRGRVRREWARVAGLRRCS